MSNKGWELGHELMDGGIRQVIDNKREGAGGKRWRVTCQSGQHGVIAMKKITPTLKTIFPDTKMSSTTSCSCEAISKTAKSLSQLICFPQLILAFPRP